MAKKKTALDKIKKVMGALEKGELTSSSGQKVTNSKRAVAIADSEKRQQAKKRKQS